MVSGYQRWCCRLHGEEGWRGDGVEAAVLQGGGHGGMMCSVGDRRHGERVVCMRGGMCRERRGRGVVGDLARRRTGFWVAVGRI